MRHLRPSETPMDNAAELTSLFSRLTAHLQPSDGLSSLVTSLNPDGTATGSRVLDAALSLMCFNSTQVFNSRIKCLLNTITSVLNGSVSCQGLSSHWAELGFVSVGSSVSSKDCCEIIRLCADSIRRLKGHCEEDVLHALSNAVLKLAVSTSPLKEGNERDVKLSDPEMRSIISELKHNLLEATCSIENEIQLRISLWYLDPSILKSEVSEILNEAMLRPFICLRNEMHDQPGWRVLILCSISSSFILTGIRSFLHNWFVETGLGTILELQNAIVYSILDVLLRPMRWGVQTEMGLNFPSTCTYFPDKNRELLAVLAGPISCSGLLDLFSSVKSEIEQEASADMVDYDSSWALVVNFPCWYYFATAILFHTESSEEYISKFIRGEILTELIDEAKLIYAACQYIAWILSPTDTSISTYLANQLSVLSKLWVRNAKATSKRSSYISRTKKLSISKVGEFEKPNLTTWLKEFQRHCFDKNLLYSKIPLGILISNHASMDQSEFELLLHYATTGEILDSRNIHMEFLRNDPASRKKAIDGARLVLNILGCIEELSMYIFECEDARLLYLSRLRGNSGFYLLRCVKFLVGLPDFDQGNLRDLYVRLVQWKDNGALYGSNELGNVLNSIRLKYCL